MVNKVGLSGAIFVLIVSSVFVYSSLDLPYASEIGPGPGFWPMWLSGLLIPLSLAYLYSAAKGTDAAEKAPDKKAGMDMIFILGSMSLYVILLPFLGFNLSSIFFLFAFLRKGYSWHKSLGISVAVAVSLFFLFTEGFTTPLPVNTWGF
ncbi:MAG TPA: tripartite tricarboxylate transporter TctB family protein [Patescibacteria group bacterium]|nr:tripartite tricarboxylate transporter TctB family protein [Patescibacteria group bacterium]